MTAQNKESFGIQQNIGDSFTENAGSNESIVKHTEGFAKVPEGPTTSLAMNKGW